MDIAAITAIFGDWRIYLGLVLTGLFMGLGTAIGNYFANRHLIRTMEGLARKLKRIGNGNKK